MRQLVKFVGIFWLCLCLAGCARPINRAAERHIREALPDLLGPARQYQVHVEGAPGRTMRGKLARVTVEADDLQLSNDLLLDHLHLDLRGVDYDTQQQMLRHIDSADFRATISQTSLDEYLAGESPPEEPIRNIRVTLRAGDQVILRAERVTLGIGVPFQLAGPMRLAGPTRIEIDPTRLVVIGLPITGAPLRFVKSHFESALDLSALPFHVRLSGIETTPGKLTLIGAADVALGKRE